jgi:hypothetical protein
MTARHVDGYDVTVSVPEFTDEALNRAVDERAAALVDEVVSQQWGGYVDVRTDVLIAGPTLVALSFRVDAYNEGGAHPYVYFDAMLWDPVAGGPLALGDVLDIALTADGEWRGAWAEALAAQVRSVLDSLSVPVEEIFDEASLRRGLITPGRDGVVVAYGQCMIVPCAVGAMRLVLPYDSVPGLATTALEQALSGPTASGD